MPKFSRKRKYRDYEINPDEIFIDDVNVSGLDKQQFEGVMEQALSRKSLLYLGILFVAIFLFFNSLSWKIYQ